MLRGRGEQRLSEGVGGHSGVLTRGGGTAKWAKIGLGGVPAY